ncbi:NUDIX domain-containing protein [Luteococcus sp. OSA5]|uniref:NUDIX domain-containing protein n=1 Tax=Luteococcus sp. OSA5 TaxID=3401630 RepID=UPI003B427D3B
MWPVTSSKVVYSNPWISVREDQVVRPDGSPGIFGVIGVQHEAVFVVALTDDDRVWMVTVDRHTTGSSLELPAGGTDGQDPLVAAQRELAEETGLQAEHWRRIGGMNALNGVAVAPEHVFLATGLSPADGLAEQDAEGITSAEALPWAEVMQRVRDGRIADGESIAALMFAALELDRVH